MADAWSNLATKTTSDTVAAADVNTLMTNNRVLGGNGTSAPSSDIETNTANISTNTTNIATNTASISGLKSADVRQTVLYGAVDTAGNASFLSEETTDDISILATTTDCTMGFSSGIENYTKTLTEDAAPANWDALTDIGIWFLYADNDGAGVITYDKTRTRPQYGQAFDITKNVLMHFDGADTSTDMTDEYGNVWTAHGNAQLKTADKVFGTASLELDGTGDYIKNVTILSLGDRFTIEFRWHCDSEAHGEQEIVEFLNAANYGIRIKYNDGAAGDISHYLSTNGSAWDIATAGAGTKSNYVDGQWYDFKAEWDGATYKAYTDGTLDYSVAMTAPICAITRIIFGCFNEASQFLDGGIDEFRLDIGYTRDEEDFTPAVAAFSMDAHWFNTADMKMYEGGPGAWVAKVRLFLGEAIMAANHVTSVVTYALRAYYDSTAFAVAVATAYTKNHNIGASQAVVIEIFFREHGGYENWMPVYRMNTASIFGAVSSVGYKKAMAYTSATYVNVDNSSQVEVSDADAESIGEYRIIVKRSF